MTYHFSRRDLLAGAGALAATARAEIALAEPAFAQTLTGGIKITMPVGQLTDEALAFVAYLGVEYVTTGGPAYPTYTTEGRVVQARASDPPPPWKEDDLRRMKDTVEKAGLKLGNVMLHDFRNAILGRPGADGDIEKVQESIRVAGRVGIPIVEYNWDTGDNDMLACLRALHQTGYPRLLHPDHVPGFPADTTGQRGGWGYAIGQIKSMMRQL